MIPFSFLFHSIYNSIYDSFDCNSGSNSSKIPIGTGIANLRKNHATSNLNPVSVKQVRLIKSKCEKAIESVIVRGGCGEGEGDGEEVPLQLCVIWVGSNMAITANVRVGPSFRA